MESSTLQAEGIGSLGVCHIKPCLNLVLVIDKLNCSFKAEMLSHGIDSLFHFHYFS